MRDLGEFLAETGAVLAGGAAIGAVIGFVAGSIAKDLDEKVDPYELAESFAAWGGLVGIVALMLRFLGVD